jgi:hypothetical protein
VSVMVDAILADFHEECVVLQLVDAILAYLC